VKKISLALHTFIHVFSQSVEVFMQTPPGERNSTSCENLSPDTSQFHSYFSFGCVFLPSVEVLMQMPPGGRVTNIDKRCVLLWWRDPAYVTQHSQRTTAQMLAAL